MALNILLKLIDDENYYSLCCVLNDTLAINLGFKKPDLEKTPEKKQSVKHKSKKRLK